MKYILVLLVFFYSGVCFSAFSEEEVSLFDEAAVLVVFSPEEEGVLLIPPVQRLEGGQFVLTPENHEWILNNITKEEQITVLAFYSAISDELHQVSNGGERRVFDKAAGPNGGGGLYRYHQLMEVLEQRQIVVVGPNGGGGG